LPLSTIFQLSSRYMFSQHVIYFRIIHFILISSARAQALVARTTSLFSNFLLTNLFSIKFLYFFIISSLLPYFNLLVSIFIQSYANIKLHVSNLLDTNNTQGMQLGRFKNRTPARFEYIYCTLFPLCHST
jgi:hypothetical protein